jgi:hypothetical protein
MTHIGTSVLNLVTGNAVVLKKLELWKAYRLTVARHFQSEKLNWDSGRGELNIDCTYKGSVTRFSIWFSFLKQNHIVWTQKSKIKVRIKMSFQNRLESYFHPTVWWESYSTYLNLRCDLLEIGSNSYRVIRDDCTLKKTSGCYLVLYLVSFLPYSIVTCYQCTSLTFLSVVSELFLWMQNKFSGKPDTG